MSWSDATPEPEQSDRRRETPNAQGAPAASGSRLHERFRAMGGVELNLPKRTEPSRGADTEQHRAAAEAICAATTPEDGTLEPEWSDLKREMLDAWGAPRATRALLDTNR